MTDNFHIAFLPVYKNPYQHLLRNELEKKGVKVELLDELPSPKWLLENVGKINLLHFHWISSLYLRRFRTFSGVVRFLYRFYLAKRLGYKLIWTAHNLLPHRYRWLPFHPIIRRIVMCQVDAVIVHCEFGRNELINKYSPSLPIYVIPHGNYLDVHPIIETREEARDSLGIESDQLVFLSLGNITEYKGIGWLWDTFKELSKPQDILIIAGRDRSPKLVRRLMSENDPRLRVHPGFIDDENMQRFLQSADIAIFAFEDILTSGSVILALSYGLPVIAPSMGCLPELITPNIGWLYSRGDPEQLKKIIEKARNTDFSGMKRECLKMAEMLNWDSIAAQTIKVYDSVISEQ